MFQFKSATTFSENIIVMENVTKEMPVVKLMKNPIACVIHKSLEPLLIIAPERDVESNVQRDFPVFGGVSKAARFVLRPAET